MKKAIVFFILLLNYLTSEAQTGKEFWFVAPEVTSGHNDRPIKLRLATSDSASTVTVSLPANAGFTPITVNLAANSASTIDLTAYIDIIENKPPNTILNNGIFIKSTQNITAYYEVDNSNNNEFFALKGESALGTEFYTPFQTYFNNGSYTPTPYSAFDIVATEDNTTILIYPKTAITGHPALTSFTITLNKGQTWSGANPTITGANNPAGTIITASKPIAVTIKTDSDANGGCRDLGGDQIVPTDIIGNEYIVVRGSVTNERVFILATQNNTVIKVNGATVSTLFGTETLDYALTTPHTYISASKPVYVYHVSGFGCELGSAILPPLNCAGSQQISFVRSTSEYFGLNLLVKTGSEGNFTLNGNTGVINASSFSAVPGTGGQWMAAQISFNTSDIPVGSANLIKNSTSIFSMGIINGGASTGCRYGYFSEFKAPIKVNAGPDKLVCANTLVSLSGSVSGGASSGVWTTNGSGFFVSGATSMNAVYKPSLSDLATGSVEFTLTSTSICFPEEDKVRINFTPAPTVDAGNNQTICANNPTTNLAGAVTVALGSLWTGGAGTYTSNTALNPTYTPAAAEIASGSLYLKLTSTGNGTCNPVSDSVFISYSPAPTVNAGADQTVCGNNANITLNGSVTVAAGAVWVGGSGTFNPSRTALNAIYSPASAEITSGSLVLSLSSTGNGSCLQVSDDLLITFTLPPTVSAGADQTLCANNASITLTGSVGLPATGGLWSGGLGNFTPGNTALGATYNPTTAEVLGGAITLTLSSTGNGICNSVSDQVTLTFTASPEIHAGPDQSICANTPTVTLAGNGLTVASGAAWSGGAGIFSPSATSLSATYQLTAAEITAGSVALTLSTTGNGSCNSVSDIMVVSITPGPTATAGPDQTLCGNNANVTLNGNISVAAGGVWSGGGGTFNPSTTALNAVYTPLSSEISSGSVLLTLTSTGNGSCTGVNDQVKINFTLPPVAAAGSDIIVCQNNAVATLAGTVSAPATGGVWSGGLGTFNPNNTTLNATYSPTASELLSGTVNLTLGSVGNGNCSVVSDAMTISFSAAPQIQAGTNQTVCGNKAAVQLNGNGLTVASGVVWTGGSGVFSPSTTVLNPVYTPSAADIAAGSVSLTITTTGNNTCNPVIDEMLVTITPAPAVQAGVDQTLCGNNANVTLNGTVQISSGAVWSGGSGTFNPSSTALNAIYSPTASEINAGSLKLKLSTTGSGMCNDVEDEIVIVYNLPPTSNAGTDQSLCANNANAALSASFTSPASGGVWSGGLGTYFPNNAIYNATYSPTNAEILQGDITLTFTTTGNGNCSPVTDDIKLHYTAAPEVSAGQDQTVCANNAKLTLAGGSLKVANGYEWQGGSGSFIPSRFDPVAQYNPSAAEINDGTVGLTLVTTGNSNCNAVADNMLITISEAPTINAGTDLSLCSNKSTVPLSASLTVAGGAVWKGGSGSFNPGPTNLNAEYTPTAAEVAGGNLTLTLESTANSNCRMVSDAVQILFTPSPVTLAGSDLVLCENNAGASLSGSVSMPAAGGIWSGGLGNFSPSNTNLAATYMPTSAEIASGSVTLFLTSTNNGNCNEAKDNVMITYTAAPEIEAGTDVSVCGNNPQVNLKATGLKVASGAVWTGGSGTFSPTSSSLDAAYLPGAADIASGLVTLSLTTTGNGKCMEVADKINITITAAPVVSAGSDVVSCANNASAIVAGSIQNAGGGIWSGGAGKFNPSNTSTVTSYTPSETEITQGFIELVLASSQNGKCMAVRDTMKISIVKSPQVNAGIDQKICTNKNDIQLNGSITQALGGQWSGGLGIFTANNSDLSAVYTPTSSELSNGLLTLRLSSTGNGSCNTVNDEVTIEFTPAPVISAGEDQSICANNATINLSGNVEVATGGTWSGGSGIFTGGINSIITNYEPSPAEVAAGSFTLVLTSTGNGRCNAVTDEIIIGVAPSPVVSAGTDVITCSNNPAASLLGSVQNAAGGIWSGGQGTFTPSSQAANTIYNPTPEEIMAGTVSLTFTSTGNGKCNAVEDLTSLIITPKPGADPGADKTVCSNNAEVALNGKVTVATGGLWSGGVGLFTPNNNALDASYSPTVSEIANGTLTLTLTTTGNGNCGAESKPMLITFTRSPEVNAGNNQSICANNATVALKGNSDLSTGVLWSGGEGEFTPGRASGEAIYKPSAGEITMGSASLKLTTTGNGNCKSVSDDVEINITSAPFVAAGSDKTVCVDNLNAELNGFISGKTTTGTWSASGSGRFVPSTDNLNTTYQVSKKDSTLGRVDLVLTSTNNGNCRSVSDTTRVFILPAGSAEAGTDQSICANSSAIQLQGKIFGGATSATWTTNGTGKFFPNSKALDAVYMPGADDTTSHNVVLTLTANSCNSGRDNVVINFIPASKADAGVDKIICVSETQTRLTGRIFGGNAGRWSSLGTGRFEQAVDTLLNTYILSEGDMRKGSAALVLQSDGSSLCPGSADTMMIFVTVPGSVQAGDDQTVCSNKAEVQLKGQAAGDGLWSGTGTGVFVPGRADKNAVYVATGADIAAGFIEIIFSSAGCSQAADSMMVTFVTKPISNAGADRNVCANNPVVELSGSVSGAGGGVWTSTGKGIIQQDTSLASAKYTITAEDVEQGFTYVYLTTTGNGKCDAASDSSKIMVSPKPVVDAGTDQSICSSSGMARVKGIVISNANTGRWKTLGSGYFIPDESTLDASYRLSSADSAKGFVSLLLESADNENCKAETDTIRIQIGKSVFVDAGKDFEICKSAESFELPSLISGGSEAGTWETNGKGIFYPNNKHRSPFYKTTGSDQSLDSIVFVLTSTSNGNCLPGTDSVVVHLQQAPQIYAGRDKEVCRGSKTVELYDADSKGSKVTWTSSDKGNFLDSNAERPLYYFSKTDSTDNQVLLVMTLQEDVCEASDTVQIRLGGNVLSDAGTDQKVCGTSSVATVTGHIAQGARGKWTTLGSGKFLQADSMLTNSYQMSSQDSILSNVKLILIASANSDCTPGRDTILIVRMPLTSLNIGPDRSICAGTNAISFNAVAKNITNILWKSSSGSSFIPNDSALTTTYQIGRADSLKGSFKVYATSTASLCGSLSDTVSVAITKASSPGFTHSDACSQTSVLFKDTTALASGSRRWSFGDNTSSEIKDPIHTFDMDKAYLVVLTHVSEEGCKDSVSKQLIVRQSPVASFKVSNDRPEAATEFNVIDQSRGASRWVYNFGDASDPDTIPAPGYIYSVPGTYTISQIVRNNYNCADTFALEVVVRGNSVLPPKLPNAFSPNEDDRNNIFYVRGGPFRTLEFKIYNVWGELIYNSEDPKEGWDGTWKGLQQPMGVYVYTVKATTIDGKSYTRSGDVTLIK